MKTIGLIGGMSWESSVKITVSWSMKGPELIIVTGVMKKGRPQI